MARYQESQLRRGSGFLTSVGLFILWNSGKGIYHGRRALQREQFMSCWPKPREYEYSFSIFAFTLYRFLVYCVMWYTFLAVLPLLNYCLCEVLLEPQGNML